MTRAGAAMTILPLGNVSGREPAVWASDLFTRRVALRAANMSGTRERQTNESGGGTGGAEIDLCRLTSPKGLEQIEQTLDSKGTSCPLVYCAATGVHSRCPN
jgi:hypothetical protein